MCQGNPQLQALAAQRGFTPNGQGGFTMPQVRTDMPQPPMSPYPTPGRMPKDFGPGPGTGIAPPPGYHQPGFQPPGGGLPPHLMPGGPGNPGMPGGPGMPPGMAGPTTMPMGSPGQTDPRVQPGGLIDGGQGGGRPFLPPPPPGGFGYKGGGILTDPTQDPTQMGRPTTMPVGPRGPYMPNRY